MCSLQVSVFTKWVWQHQEVLVLLRSHLETMLWSGGRKRSIKLDCYSICTRGLVYTTCVQSEESGAEVRGPKGLSSEFWVRGGFGIDSSIAGIDTLHRTTHATCLVFATGRVTGPSIATPPLSHEHQQLPTQQRCQFGMRPTIASSSILSSTPPPLFSPDPLCHLDHLEILLRPSVATHAIRKCRYGLTHGVEGQTQDSEAGPSPDSHIKYDWSERWDLWRWLMGFRFVVTGLSLSSSSHPPLPMVILAVVPPHHGPRMFPHLHNTKMTDQKHHHTHNVVQPWGWWTRWAAVINWEMRRISRMEGGRAQGTAWWSVTVAIIVLNSSSHLVVCCDSASGQGRPRTEDNAWQRSVQDQCSHRIAVFFVLRCNVSIPAMLELIPKPPRTPHLGSGLFRSHTRSIHKALSTYAVVA